MLRASTRWCLCAALLFSGTAASAQTNYEGVWRAGVTTMAVKVQSWGGDCGPRPASSKSAGGGSVRVTQDAKHLVIHSKGSQVRTDLCWSRNPAMRRRSSNYREGVWTTRCKTRPQDPRAEQGTYTLKTNGPDQLVYRDTSKYNWKLKTSECIATITTTQTLNRVGKSAGPLPPKTAPPASKAKTPQRTKSKHRAEPTAEAEPVADKCEPGPAHKLSVRPRRAELAPGERVCLRARVVDAQGCRLRHPRVSWELKHSRALKGALEGSCFTAGDSAAEAEGEYKVRARLRGLQAEAQITVRAVDLSDLIAHRLETGAVSGFEAQQTPRPDAPEALQAPGSTAAKVATRRVRQREESSPGMWALLGLGLLIMAGLGYALRRRKPLAVDSAPADNPASQAPAPPKGESRVPSELSPAQPMPAATVVEAGAQAQTGQWICPSCRVGYPPGTVHCPKDGTVLLPYNQYVQQQKSQSQTAAPKRCPTCGRTFPPGSGFCSEDGSELQ